MRFRPSAGKGLRWYDTLQTPTYIVIVSMATIVESHHDLTVKHPRACEQTCER